MWMKQCYNKSSLAARRKIARQRSLWKHEATIKFMPRNKTNWRFRLQATVMTNEAVK
jgi:hypothetical protein